MNLLPTWALRAVMIVALLNCLSWIALYLHWYAISTLAWWFTWSAFTVTSFIVVVTFAMLFTHALAVHVEIAWQGRLQRAWVPRDTVTTRKLAPRR